MGEQVVKESRSRMDPAPLLIIVPTLLLFILWGFCVSAKFMTKIYLCEILDKCQIEICEDGYPKNYKLTELYYLYDPEQHTISGGGMGEAMASFSNPLEEIKIKQLSFPSCTISYGKMVLDVNLKTGEVKPANDLAYEIFSLEERQFFSQNNFSDNLF